MKIDMKVLLAEARTEVGLMDARREAARRKMYDELLVHVKDFEYLTSMEEPTAENPGFLVFSVSQFRLRVECNIKKYYIYNQDCPENSPAAKRWYGGRDEEDAIEVCKVIAQGIAEELSKQADPEEVTA